MSLCVRIAEFKLYISNSPFGVGLGYREHEFLDQYIRFLVSQNLIIFDYSDYLIDVREREMSPTFLFPLTSRGRELTAYIHELDDRYNASMKDAARVRVAQERYLTMVFPPYDDERLGLIEKFKHDFTTEFKRQQKGGA